MPGDYGIRKLNHGTTADYGGNLWGLGTAAPSNTGDVGYLPGAEFLDYVLGNKYANFGTVTTPVWRIVGRVGSASYPSPRNVHVGGTSAQIAADGNDTTPSATETYIGEVTIPTAMTITGVAVFNGSAVGTDKLMAILYDSTGAVVAKSATAGITASGTDAYQRLVFTAAYVASPGTYYVGIQCNGTTYRLNTFAVGNFGASKTTGDTFGTAIAITPPTTFTTVVAPIASLY